MKCLYFPNDCKHIDFNIISYISGGNTSRHIWRHRIGLSTEKMNFYLMPKIYCNYSTLPIFVLYCSLRISFKLWLKSHELYLICSYLLPPNTSLHLCYVSKMQINWIWKNVFWFIQLLWVTIKSSLKMKWMIPKYDSGIFLKLYGQICISLHRIINGQLIF